MSLLIAFALVALLALWLLSEPWRARRRRRRVYEHPFPAAWRQVLRRRVPLFRRLPVDLQLRLKKLIQVFLAEKPFIGCSGLVVDDEMRVTIAAEACLLVLNRGGVLFPALRQVLLYPGPFLVDRVRASPAGVLQEHRRVLSGESWAQGQVILSWPDVLEGAAVPDDGHNVVIHEFAHQLDQEDGTANGAPPLPNRAHYARWSEVMSREFEALRQGDGAVPGGLINDYGAGEPAEFFAVLTEVFFEQAQRLAAEHPGLYKELAGFYRVDPAHW